MAGSYVIFTTHCLVLYGIHRQGAGGRGGYNIRRSPLLLDSQLRPVCLSVFVCLHVRHPPICMHNTVDHFSIFPLKVGVVKRE